MLPENEAQRLNALRRYQILDTPPEPAFDRIAEMAANIFHVSMAGISLVDEDRVWIKARVGTNVDQVAREAGLCSSAMLSQGVYHLRDAAHDERALGHSFVNDLGIRFYAAAPLRTNDGFDLGTVWVPKTPRPRNGRSRDAAGIGGARDESDGTATAHGGVHAAGTRATHDGGGSRGGNRGPFLFLARARHKNG